MRRFHLVVATGVVVAVVTQFYFAAVGVFTAPQHDEAYWLHTLNGRVVLPALIILSGLTAALARLPGRQVGLAFLPLGLLTLQVVLFIVAGALGSSPERTTTAGQFLLGLHAVNGLAILAVSLRVVARARGAVAAIHGARPAAGESIERAQVPTHAPGPELGRDATPAPWASDEPPAP